MSQLDGAVVAKPFFDSLPCVWSCMRFALKKLRTTMEDKNSELTVLATTDMPALHKNMSAALTDAAMKFRVVPLDPVDKPILHLTLHTPEGKDEGVSSCSESGAHAPPPG